MPFHGCLLPVKRCGNLIGRMTASFSASLAWSRPATSSHLMLGLSDSMAPARAPRSFFASGSCSSSSSSLQVVVLVSNLLLQLAELHALTCDCRRRTTLCHSIPLQWVSFLCLPRCPPSDSSTSPLVPCTPLFSHESSPSV